MNSLKPLLLKDQRISIYHALDEKHMLTLMLETDLAIVPASGILLEVLAVGCRVISGIYTDNQKFIYSNYKKINSFIDAFDFSDIHLNKAIKKALNGDRKDKEIFDGISGKRLLNRFLQLILKDKVKLRKAGESDVNITYKWATEPLIRAYSFNQKFISNEEHTLWFKTKITDTNCLYFIAFNENDNIGSIRFDIREKDAIISYLIDPKYHGQGFGLIILSLGIDYLSNAIRTNSLNIQKIIGYVLKSNIASIKSFERLGFNKYNYQNNYIFEKLI
jgi:RimJ/RimL family protein N-acetyltransferase